MSNYWKIPCPSLGFDTDFCSRCGFTCSSLDGYGFESCGYCGNSYCGECKEECLLRPLNTKKKTENEKRTAEKNKKKNRNHHYDDESEEESDDEFEENCGCYDCKNQNVEDVSDEVLYKYAFFKLGRTREELREMYGEEKSLHPRHLCPVEGRELAIRFARMNASNSAVEEESNENEDEKVKEKDEKVEKKVYKKVKKEVEVEKKSIQKSKYEEESDSDEEDDEDIDENDSDNEDAENENEKDSDDEEEKKEKPKKVFIKKVYKKAESEDEEDEEDEKDSDDEDKMKSDDENEDSGDEEQEEETGISTFDPESLIKSNHRPIVVELYRKITRFFNSHYFRRYLNMNSNNDLGFYKYERFCYYQLFYLNKLDNEKLMELNVKSKSLVGYMDFEDMCVGYLSNMCFGRTGLVIYLRPR